MGRVVSERGMDEHGCHFCNASFHLPPAAKGGAPSRAVRRKNEQADSRHSGKYQCFAVGAANRTYPFQRWHEVSRTSISEHLHVSGVINSVACESVRINPYRILNALPGTHAPAPLAHAILAFHRWRSSVSQLLAALNMSEDMVYESPPVVPSLEDLLSQYGRGAWSRLVCSILSFVDIIRRICSCLGSQRRPRRLSRAQGLES